MSQISLQNLKNLLEKLRLFMILVLMLKMVNYCYSWSIRLWKINIIKNGCRLEDANEGNILIDNKKVNELEPMERNIAMVFKIMLFILI
jgi:archaellum component FlaF (FlaF/FlaG flagellin family)